MHLITNKVLKKCGGQIMKTLKYSLLVFLLLVSMLCEKKPLPDVLPPLTTTGENTFGCLIEGEVFVPTIRRFVGPDGFCSQKTHITDFPMYPAYYFMFSACRVAARSDTVGDIRINVFVKNIKTLNSYNINLASVAYKGNVYYCDSTRAGEIEIVYLDTINKIISGTFNFTAINRVSEKTISVADGRLDLKQE
jgi:hypothetical protein